MDSIRVSEAPDPSSILGEATKKIPPFGGIFLVVVFEMLVLSLSCLIRDSKKHSKRFISCSIKMIQMDTYSMPQRISGQYFLMFLFVTLFTLNRNDAFGQSGLINPITYFSSKSKAVGEKSYYANVSATKPIQYFKSLGMIKYSPEEYDPNTIRFRNANKNVYIMVFPVSANCIYIVVSRMQYVDEVDV